MAVLTALTSAAFIASGAPASATGHNIAQQNSDPTYCLTKTSNYFCFVYDASIKARSAVWGSQALSVNDLAGRTFANGTGSNNGNGQAVKNNAGAMVCYFTQCRSWVNENQSGNYDFEGGVQYGELFYTFNNEASFSAS